jgi:hypothetical protein
LWISVAIWMKNNWMISWKIWIYFNFSQLLQRINILFGWIEGFVFLKLNEGLSNLRNENQECMNRTESTNGRFFRNKKKRGPK